MAINAQWEKIEIISTVMNMRLKKKVKREVEAALKLIREYRARYGNAVQPKTLTEEVVYWQLIDFEPIDNLFTDFALDEFDHTLDIVPFDGY